ncbi:hypothetical protein H0H81_011539 [Sphagnurus paluster]|uniref:Cytochrome P450 n=1 Tax=Sphagnurus paluster TaxID=117069 RepID=A0A9P7FNN2_9AGAR|nr:hypothetical protein H0H81_011539 [Sphagnurus paluster]
MHLNLPTPPLSLQFGGALLLVLGLYRLSRKPRHPPLPPSPPADALIGHLKLAPKSDFDVFFYKMGQIYGRIMHLNFMGSILIVVNDVQTAIDLLDKRSANYSCRGRIRVFECMGWTKNLGFLQYGKDFQLHRRMYQEFFNKNASEKYQAIQLREARTLTYNLATDPKNMENHFNLFSTAIILDIVHGHRAKSSTDPLVKLADEATAIARQVGGTESGILDMFPFLVRMPSWFPGTYYARFARAKAPTFRALCDYPVGLVREKMAQGTAKPSLVSSYLDALQNGNEFGFEFGEDDVKGVATSAYFAGAETARAQEELDRVLGEGRLPEFSDRASLQYLECILQETLRCNHPAPTGIPHRVLEDDIYDGMFIPKGSVLIPNIRGMTWDEKIYSDPKSFDPTRFLPKPEGRGEPLPAATWGFGRRICPGRHVGDASLWIAMATILSTLKISKAVDGEGKEITPEVEFFMTMASRPKPFPYQIQPRSEVAREMIRQVELDTD